MPKKSATQRLTVRKWYKSLLERGKTTEAEAYRSTREWAWKKPEPNKLRNIRHYDYCAGEEGVQAASESNSGTNPHALAVNGLQRGFKKEGGRPVVWEWKPEKAEVVWKGDPEGTEEVEVVGVPRNVLMRVIRVGSGEGILRVARWMPSMMRWRVAARREGGVWELVGEYDRRNGDRYA